MSIQNIKPDSRISPIVNVRIPRDEMEIIRTAARSKSIAFSTFIRSAAIEAARKVNADATTAS